MPINEEVQAAINELVAIADQKAEVLKEFGKKYSELEAQVKDLEKKRDELVGFNKSEAESKEVALAVISAAEKKAAGIISGAEAEARKSIEQAKKEASVILDEANGIKIEAEQIRIAVKETIDSAESDRKESKANVELTGKALREAETDRIEALQANRDANRALLDANAFLSRAKEREDETIKMVSVLNSRLAEIGRVERELDEKKTAISDMELMLNKRVSEFNAFATSKQAEIDEKFRLIDVLNSGIKKQEEDNAWRSRELDIGFELLKNKQAVLDRDIKRLETLKKELSK